MTNIGYIRVSSAKQTLQHQRFEIENFARREKIKINCWIEEKISSRKSLDRRKLGSLLNCLEPNDILITCEISRLGRSLLEVMKILEICLNKNCQVWTIKENYRLGDDIQSKVLAFAFSLAAEIERNLISQRTKTSLDSLKSKGRKLGRPYSDTSKKLSHNKKYFIKLLQEGHTKAQIAKKFKVNRSTASRFIDRLLEQNIVDYQDLYNE